MAEDDAEDIVRPIGVGLKISEARHLSEIAHELGVNRHQLLVWLVRDFFRRWSSGYRPPTELRRVLRDPSKED